MTREPAADVLIPAERVGRPTPPAEPRIVGLSEYYRLLLSHRSIDRVQRGLPRGYQGLHDPETGQTWLIAEDVLIQAG